MAYEKIKEKLCGTTQQVFCAILDLGPTHNNRILEYLHQQESLKPRACRRLWQINQVCGRVNDLVNKHAAVIDLGPHRGFWYGDEKTYHLWRVRGDNREPAGWMKIERALPKPKRPWPQRKANLDRIRAEGEDSVVKKMAASEAGRVLVAQRHKRRRGSPNQMVLFG